MSGAKTLELQAKKIHKLEAMMKSINTLLRQGRYIEAARLSQKNLERVDEPHNQS